MTVLLLGIGGDTTNCSPTPPVFGDGTFEYIPIPESVGPEGTVEKRTYGSTPLQQADGSMAAYLDAIRPNGTAGPRLRGEALATWPLHHDPNFEALTYGETASRAAYVHRLRQLEPGDVVAFYTGLQRPAGGPRHRYVIGAFTVAEIVDCQRIAHRGEHVRFGELPAGRQRAIMREHAMNAHAKRFLAADQIAAKDDGLIIVDGTDPGGLLDRAVRISTTDGSGHHYLTDELRSRWSPQSVDPTGDAYLGGIKQAHRLDVDPDAFWDDIT